MIYEIYTFNISYWLPGNRYIEISSFPDCNILGNENIRGMNYFSPSDARVFRGDLIDVNEKLDYPSLPWAASTLWLGQKKKKKNSTLPILDS